MYRACKKHLSHLKRLDTVSEEVPMLILTEAEAEVAKPMKPGGANCAEVDIFKIWIDRPVLGLACCHRRK